jgi:hypothetical protein
VRPTVLDHSQLGVALRVVRRRDDYPFQAHVERSVAANLTPELRDISPAASETRIPGMFDDLDRGTVPAPTATPDLSRRIMGARDVEVAYRLVHRRPTVLIGSSPTVWREEGSRCSFR